MKNIISEFQIKRLGEDDVLAFQKLIELFQEVFEMEKPEAANESYLKTMLAKQNFIVYVVTYRNEIAGGLTAYELPMYYSQQSEIFIYDIAVKTEFQRKGLGKQLILSLKEYCRQMIIKEMFVAAHVQDKDAINFYYSTGAKAEKVVHFNYDLD